jgi:hypothetical protein
MPGEYTFKVLRSYPLDATVAQLRADAELMMEAAPAQTPGIRLQWSKDGSVEELQLVVKVKVPEPVGNGPARGVTTTTTAPAPAGPDPEYGANQLLPVDPHLAPPAPEPGYVEALAAQGFDRLTPEGDENLGTVTLAIDRLPEHEQARRAARANEATNEQLDIVRTDGEIGCPKCGGRMWDNRETKRNPKAPDYKCRDRSCDGVIWPPKPGANAPKPGRETPVGSRGEAKGTAGPRNRPEDDDIPF